MGELENPYLDEFRASMPDWKVPPQQRKLSFARYQLRQRLVARYAWAIPDETAIRLLVGHSPLVEMGAGTGYWAWLVRQAGGDILAFDRYPPPDPRNRWHAGEQPWTEVLPGGPKRLVRHPERTLFLCWPPPDEPMAEQCVDAYSGETLIYVGEMPRGDDGPAPAEGPAGLGRVMERWEPAETVELPQWESIQDRLVVLRRRSRRGRELEPSERRASR